MDNILSVIGTIFGESGFAGFLAEGGWKNLIMIALAFVLLYLGIVKKFEPLLLVGIAFGTLLTNLPGANLYHPELWTAYMNEEITLTNIIHDGGLLDILYIYTKIS